MLHFKTKEAEIRYNDLARQIFICRLQKELLTDAAICGMMYKDNTKALAAFMDYVTMIKAEIDNIVNRANSNDIR